jgi:hypothetical protein
MYLGINYLDMEAGILTQVDSITGEYHFEPIYSYLKNWMVFSAGTLVFVGVLYKNEASREDSGILGGVTILVLTIVSYLYWFEPLEKEGIMKSRQIIFWFLGILQILTALFLINKDWLLEFVHTKLRQFFFIAGILYIGVLGLGFFCVDLQQAIVSIINDESWRSYEGIHPNFPIDFFYLMLTILLLISSVFFGSAVSMVTNSTRNTTLNEVYVTAYLVVLTFWVLILFMTILALASRDMSLDTNIATVGGYLFCFVLPSFFFSLIGENKPIEASDKGFIKNSDILDDSFH